MVLHLHEDWPSITGQHAEIWLHGNFVAAGIAAQADDAETIWLSSGVLSSISKYEREDGFEVWGQGKSLGLGSISLLLGAIGEPTFRWQDTDDGDAGERYGGAG